MQYNDSVEIIQVIDAIKHGNYTDFNVLYDYSKKQVYYTIYQIIKNKDITEDLMQDTYLKFIHNVRKYKDGTNVIAYLVTIARNQAINYYNKNKRIIACDFENANLIIENNGYKTPLLDLVKDNLTEEEFTIFSYHALYGLTHKEIAKILNKPLGTITWQYNVIVKKLKERIGDNYE